MEGLIFLAALVALAWLAPRYGADSREGPESAEHLMAQHGLRWEHRVAS
jgi:hypothetical protein